MIKDIRIVSPLCTVLDCAPSSMVASAVSTVRMTPNAGVERRSLLISVSKFFHNHVRGELEADPSKAYFLSFSKASGSSERASARIAGQ